MNIPPAGAIGNKIQRAVGRPLWLKDRFVQTARNVDFVRDRAIRSEFSDPQLTTIPRHVWVVPGQPCYARPVRTETRRGVKIIAEKQNAAGLNVAIKGN